ncbi:MAG: hypothetical protein J0L92_21045 [Deltaproteobacteria bacterium]|nr:hypothetical protein [Deltaproteobacteria bacterium]
MSTRSLLSTLVVSSVSASSILLGGCLATHSTEALDVDVTLASVTLAQDCAPEGAGEPGIAGDCAEDAADGCGGWCTQSTLQLHITASAEGTEVPFEIVSVRVTDSDAALVGSLTTRNPRVFTEDSYSPWDQTIAPSDDLSVTYDTSAPDWYASGARYGWGTVYHVEVVVRVDGVERTLQGEAMREPEIVT